MARLLGNKGYSFVELLTVIAVFGILGLASANLFFSTLVGTRKEASLRQIKQNGEFILVQLENELRTASAILPDGDTVSQPCTTDMKSIVYELEDDEVRRLIVNSDSGHLQLQSYDSQEGEWETDDGNNLTAGAVRVLLLEGGEGTQAPPSYDLHIDCNQTNSTTSVSVQFTLTTVGDGETELSEDYEESFSMSVTLRNKYSGGA